MSPSEFALLAFSSMFVIIDPIAVVPSFLAMTSSSTPQERARTARLACTIASLVLFLFAIAGTFIFKLFGITLPAFQIAGSIVLMIVALDMIQAKRSPVKETKEEKTEGALKEEIAITPLGVPMLAGPGAISTAILLDSKAQVWHQKAILYVCIVLACLASYVVLRVSAGGARWLNPIAMRITVRLMGLMLGAIAVQFMLNALRTIAPSVFSAIP